MDDLTAEEEVELESILSACEDLDNSDTVSKTELSKGFDNKKSGWLKGTDYEDA
jgi:hypothetical protein